LDENVIILWTSPQYEDRIAAALEDETAAGAGFDNLLLESWVEKANYQSLTPYLVPEVAYSAG
jgi:hypothetical protein